MKKKKLRYQPPCGFPIWDLTQNRHLCKEGLSGENPRLPDYVTFPIEAEANDSFKGPTIGSNSDKETILTEKPIFSA